MAGANHPFRDEALSEFVPRHIGPSPQAQAKMLADIGYPSLSALVDAAVPYDIRTSQELRLSAGVSEAQAAAELRDLADRNVVSVPMIGLGYHATSTPAVIRRNVLENPAWYTAYTPYQPEISQGRLEALLNFQTMVRDLTGLSTANASLLDEGTAVAEAMTLMSRANQNRNARVLLDADTLPQTKAVVRTRAEALGLDIIEIVAGGELPEADFVGLILSYPGRSGSIVDPRAQIDAAHQRGALVTITCDLLALTLLESPGDLGADVAVGSSQRFGVPLFYGGPHAGFMSVRAGLKRHLPGRLVGVSRDAQGSPALRLALQTREQHIRRDRATSNICTAQVLLAVVSSLYAAYHGPGGLTRIARRVHEHTADIADALTARRIHVLNATFFDTLTVAVPGRAADVVEAAREQGIRLHFEDSDTVGLSCSELTTDAHVAAVVASFAPRDEHGPASTVEEEPAAQPGRGSGIPANLSRSTEFLSHEVFNTYHSETAMLRYLRRLADRDLALDRGMIPLGSCTMKLNAATEMEPISLPGFADIHPFAPARDALGYQDLVRQLEEWLAEVTGYARVSVQPNAGSQGELAGLLAIRAYHRSRGEDQRDVCLIPSSAHGTNAASAVLAGMRVVVVASREDGTVDLDDLEAQCELHPDDVAAIMVTYPSTHGVYESGIRALCDLVHTHGGQVYVDGANMNALMGVARPGDFGGDVSHLNLHKTFCIPHGGGGPGVGPVAVAAHLAPYLPTHPFHPDPERRTDAGAVSAAPYGSAGVLPIAWAYIRMMGARGLAEATQVAVLNANYLAVKLSSSFPVLYTGARGLVAHECILDLRPLTAATGITVEDVAKRLIDYGFHAPTMSFPVPGTLMIEPTESEDLAELDRFVAAMAAIRAEIEDVATGRVPVEASPLARAPHTAAVVIGDDWSRPYPRSQAVFPAGSIEDKYWPPVARVEQAYGDRNLVCSCPPPTAYES